MGSVTSGSASVILIGAPAGTLQTYSEDATHLGKKNAKKKFYFGET